jgi:mannose-1-phosphate guanylyltransferase
LQAVILAGGFGTRLRPLTLTCPKPLVPVANVPIIRRIIDKLPRDVDKVVLAVNYKLDMLARYFAEHDVGREVVLVEEKEPLGTAGAIKNVEREIDGPFLVLNGDVLDSLDVAAFRRFHESRRAFGTIALWEVADPRHFGVMEMDGERIVRFVEKPETPEAAPSRLANAGTYLLEPGVFDLIPPGKAVSVERETFPALIASGRRLVGFPFTGSWIDAGRPDTYLAANEAALQAAGRRTLVGPGTKDAGAVFDDWAVVGPGCALGAGATLARSVLLEGVRVGANATVRGSILAPGVVVEDDAALVDCVVGAGARVEKGVLLKNVKVDPAVT